MPSSTISSRSNVNVIGKNELLQWCSKTAKIKCQSFQDLASGVVFLKIFENIWPKFIDLKKSKWKVSISI